MTQLIELNLDSSATTTENFSTLRNWMVTNHDGSWMTKSRRQPILLKNLATNATYAALQQMEMGRGMFSDFQSTVTVGQKLTLDDVTYEVIAIFDQQSWSETTEWFNDIPLSTATSAYSATSHSPDRRGRSQIIEYCITLDHAQRKLAKYGFEERFDEFKEGYKKRLLAYLHANSRVMSPMITGPARFPVSSNRKKSDTSDKRLSELVDWEKTFFDRCRRNFNGSNIIKSSDSDAVQKLEAKIAAKEEAQAKMKSINKIIRKKGSKPEDIVEFGLTLKGAQELFKPDFAGRLGFASYSLTNNNAEIKRLKKRLVELKEKENAEETEKEIMPGLVLKECPDDYRIRLLFDDKPSQKTRDILKSNGFKWSYSNEAWQRHLNAAGKSAANRVIQTLTADAA